MAPGSNKDHLKKMTEGKVSSLIIQLAIPSTISMLISNLYNMVDTAFVGRLGTSASAAAGLVFGFMAFIQALGFLFGQGSGSILARKLGQNQLDDASKIASTGLVCSFLLGLGVEALGFIYMNKLVVLLGATESTYEYAKAYLFFILLGTPFMTTSYSMNTVLRYEGKAVFAMRGMLTGAIVNIFGDILFMFGLEMGIAGAGLATAMSQILGFCILLSAFLRKKTQCLLTPRLVSRSAKDYFDIATTGLPSMVRQVLTSVTTIMLNTAASSYGDAAVSAMSIVNRVMFFVFALAVGISQGFQPVCGTNYGAGKYSRVREAYKVTVAISTLSVAILTVLVLWQCEPLLRLFRDDAEVIQIGARALRLQAYTQLLLPVCMVTETMFQSVGQRMEALVLSFARNGIFMIPALLILARLRGLSGIQEAYPVACILAVPPTVLLAVIFFRALPEDDDINDIL